MSLPQLPKVKAGSTDAETIRNLMGAYKELCRVIEAFMPYIGSENIPFLVTEETQIRSDRGETEIKGPLLLMYDKQEPPVLRRKIGYDPESTKFVDEWYNPSGVLTAYIDTNGKLIVVDGEFKGTIDIGSGNFTVDATGTVRIKKDVTIGNKLYLGTEAVNKALYMGLSFLECLFDGKYNMHLYSNGYLNIVSEGDMQIFSGTGAYPGNAWDFNGASVIGLETSGYALRSWVTLNYQPKFTGVSGSFTSADGKTITVSDGIITSIA